MASSNTSTRSWIVERRKWVIVITIVAAISVALLFQFGGLLIGIPVTLTVGLIAGGVSVFSVVHQVKSQRQASIDAENRRQQLELASRSNEKKAEVYSEFTRVWMEVFLGSAFEKARHGHDPNTANDAMLRFMPGLMVWGSDQVVLKFADMKTESNQQLRDDTMQEYAEDNLRSLAHIILTMRSELGYDVNGLKEDTLLETFITGWREKQSAKGQLPLLND